ncbi:tetratricopeptide repeat protein [Flavobacterium sp. N1736]|uniref:tetratricopeptide repeat protein n=1 Tax=Flavobacterium sp. N1736 TaxID=2986823 RepID=UPI0022244C97|nr:tetratricopeptide repeat protein [Flavobacterium sp. N1736]
MKWFTNLTIEKIKGKFSKSNTSTESVHFEKGKELYFANQFQEAIIHFDNAITSGLYYEAYKLKGNCLQKLDYHYNAIEDFDKAIEANPLDFSNYYSRAVSKKAILDFTGQIEDLHNAIYYYRKNSILENSILRSFENDLLFAKMKIEGLTKNAAEIARIPSLEIKSLIRDSLHLIKQVKLKNTALK